MADFPYFVFDVDGTLLDSDAALVAPFVALGVDPADITFGHVLSHECARLGVEVDRYLDLYDEDAATPFPGVVDMLAHLAGWSVCSNKHPRPGLAELARLGWSPDEATFSDAFDGGPKSLTPLLARLGLGTDQAVFVGDTNHDRMVADAADVRFILAGWNPRAESVTNDLVARHPEELFDILDRR